MQYTFFHVHSSFNLSSHCHRVQKVNLKMMVTRKQNMQNFPKTNISDPPDTNMQVCISGG